MALLKLFEYIRMFLNGRFTQLQIYSDIIRWTFRSTNIFWHLFVWGKNICYPLLGIKPSLSLNLNSALDLKGQVFKWKFLAWSDLKTGLFNTYNDSNCFILKFKHYMIWYAKCSHLSHWKYKKCHLSIWSLQELSIPNIPLWDSGPLRALASTLNWASILIQNLQIGLHFAFNLNLVSGFTIKLLPNRINGSWPLAGPQTESHS